MKSKLKIAGGILAVLLLGAVLYGSRLYQKMMTTETIQHDPQLRIVIGGSGNSIVLTSEDNSQALVVDTKMKKPAMALRKSVSAKNIILVNTHFHPDHVGGNSLYPGAAVMAGDYTQEQWSKGTGALPFPGERIRAGEEKVIPLGSETVHIRNMGQAHTWNDVVVYLEKRKLLVTGDLVFLGSHPVLKTSGGAKVSAWIKALDTLGSLYDIRELVPGHGKLSDRNALGAMRDYFQLMSEAVKDPEKEELLKNKYQDYQSIPGMSGFEKTLAFIRQEEKIP